MKFTVVIELDSRVDKGDTVVRGTATCLGSILTSGGRLTSVQKRGGLTVASVEDEVAANLAKLAARSVRRREG